MDDTHHARYYTASPLHRDGYNAKLELSDEFSLFAWQQFMPLIGPVEGLAPKNFGRVVLVILPHPFALAAPFK
jgi:hypothetical protein